MNAGIPTLTTPRLYLRGPKEADFPVFAEFCASERARSVGGPYTREVAWRSFAALWGHWILRGYGRWSLEDRESGQVVGNVGLWNPVGWPEPEIGWTVFTGAEGKGYATEAALAARAYAYKTLGWTTVISSIAPDNERSLALAKRLGAQQDGEFEHERFGLLQIWRHPSPEQA